MPKYVVGTCVDGLLQRGSVLRKRKILSPSLDGFVSTPIPQSLAGRDLLAYLLARTPQMSDLLRKLPYGLFLLTATQQYEVFSPMCRLRRRIVINWVPLVIDGVEYHEGLLFGITKVLVRVNSQTLTVYIPPAGCTDRNLYAYQAYEIPRNLNNWIGHVVLMTHLLAAAVEAQAIDIAVPAVAVAMFFRELGHLLTATTVLDLQAMAELEYKSNTVFVNSVLRLIDVFIVDS